MIRRTRGVTIDFVKLANGGGSSYKFEDKKIGLKRKKDKELDEVENVAPVSAVVQVPKKQKLQKESKTKRSTSAEIVNHGRPATFAVPKKPQLPKGTLSKEKKEPISAKKVASTNTTAGSAKKKNEKAEPKPEAKKQTKKPPKVKKTLAKPIAREEDVREELKYFCRIQQAGNYELGSLLGCGTFGIVREAVEKTTKKVKAVKFVKKGSLIHLEETIFELVTKHGGNRYLGVPTSYVDFRFEGELITGFVMDKLQMDLYDVLHLNKIYIPTTTICSILAQVASANVFLNGIGVIHSDLKLENIMLLDHEIIIREQKAQLVKPSIKLIDFNSAIRKKANVMGYNGYFQTDIYRSPEIILGCSYMDNVDMWSLGVIGLELLTGRNFFNIEANLTFKPEVEAIHLKKILAACAPQTFTPLMLHTCIHLRACRAIEAAEAGQQTTMDEVLSSRRKTPDMKRLSYAIGNMLVIDNKKRSSASEVLQVLQRYLNDKV